LSTDGERSAQGWRRCSACKTWIPFDTAYTVCSVSTCNRKRTGLVFCNPDCWEIHLPTAHHREAWAVEERSPRAAAASATSSAGASAGRAPQRRLVRPAESTRRPSEALPDEVLVVASRLKAYVQARAGMNTSDRVLEPLSEILRRVCDRAIENARRDGRKTLLERDIPCE